MSRKIFQKTWVFLFLCTGCGPGIWLSTPDDSVVQVGAIRSTVRLTSTAITWDAGDDYSSYVLVRSDISTTSFDLAAQTSLVAGTALDSHATVVCNGTNTTCSDTGLTAGTRYYYFVYGGNASGTYTKMAQGSATTGPILTDVMGGTPRHIAVSGNTAVMSQRAAGLIIADISALPTVTLLSRYFNSNWFINALVENSYIYAGNGDEGLTIIDIHDASTPTLVSTLALGGSTGGLLKYGNFLYACNSQGLMVIDVSTITAPQLLSTTSMVTLCNTLQKSGDFLYAATRTDGLNIYSVAQPASPTLVRNVPTATSAVDVLVRGSYAYVSAGTGGVRIVDISAPASAAIVATFAATTSVNSVSSSGGYLYVSDDAGLRIVDASDPIALSQVGAYAGKGPGSLYSSKSGNYVLDAGAAFLEVVDVSTPASPTLAGELAGGSALGRLDYRDDFVSFAFTGAGVLGGTINSDGKFTQTLFISGYPSAPAATFADSTYLYVAGAATTSLAIFDRSLSAPTAIGTLGSGSGTAVFIEGNTAYLSHSSGIRTIDITNKASPTVLGSLAGGNNNSISKSGNYLYLTDNGGNLRVVNVSNLAAPTSQAVMPLSTPYIGVVNNNLLAVGRQSAGVSLFDISTPSSPSLLTTLTGLGDIRAVAFHDKYLFVSGYLVPNITVFDVTDPANPVQVAQVAAGATALSIYFDHANETAIFGIRAGGAMSFKSIVP